MRSSSVRDLVRKRRYKSPSSPEPELPRVYVSKACEACRTRKTKCSGTSPTCNNCTKHARECVYLDDGRKLRGKMLVERSQAETGRSEQALEVSHEKTTGGVTGSVPEMELGSLTNEPPDLQAVLPYLDPETDGTDDRNIRANNSIGPQGAFGNRHVSLDGPLPVEPFSTGGTFLCLNGALHLHAQASLYQGLHITPEQMAAIGHRHVITRRTGPICKPWEAPYIPLAMTEKDHQTILELGFQAVSFALSSGWKRRFLADMSRDPEDRTSTYSPFVHLVILAYGWRYCQEYPIIARYTHLGHTYDERGYIFAESARSLTEAEYASPKVCTVVGLDLLAMFLAGTNKGMLCGPLHSIATHYTQEFRLNRKCDDQLLSTASGEELDVARRDAFAVNRIVSSWWTSNFGRADLDLTSSADQRPPAVDLDVDGKPLHQDGMVLHQYYELATKAHTIYDALHVVSLLPAHRIEVVLRLNADMDAWHSRLPSSARVVSNDHTVRSGFNLLALLCLYQTYRILIYRPFCAWQPGLSNLLPQAMQECKTAADHIIRYVRVLKETNDVRTAPYTLQYTLYVAGTALLLQCSMIGHPVSPQTSAQAKLDLAEVIDVLGQLGEVWPSASTSAEALKTLRGVWAG